MKGLLAIGVCLLAALDARAQTQYADPPTARAAPAALAPSNIHPAVARIVAPGNGSISYGSGTLVYVNDQQGVVITNWHVVNEATGPVSVHFPDGFYSPGTIHRVDHDWDLAAIVIRRPNAQPVRVANEAPRPGELLTIAGYGSGNYRAASGPCTQYVAPGTTFPYEMVEVAVSARQGDSGGPIFNSRGELAGVLFGEGNGRTSGSYCGRVRWFLSSVLPPAPASNTMLASGPLKPVSPRPPARPATAEPSRVVIAPAPVMRNSTTTHVESDFTTARLPHGAVVASTRASETAAPLARQLGWQDLAGVTVGEQIKTVLAGIGALAMLLHALRWMSREVAETT